MQVSTLIKVFLNQKRINVFEHTGDGMLHFRVRATRKGTGRREQWRGWREKLNEIFLG